MSFNTDRRGLPVALVKSEKVKKPQVVWFDADDHTGSSSLTIPKEKPIFLTPVPYSIGAKEGRDVWYLSGQSGVGKSYLTAQLCELYKDKGLKLFVISPEPDAKLKRLGAKYLNIESIVRASNTFEKENAKYQEMKIRFKYQKAKFKDDPDALMKMELHLNSLKPDPAKKGRLEFCYSPDVMEEMFSDSVIVFDDYVEGTTDGTKRNIEFFRDVYLTRGRHTNTSMILCHHLGNDGQKTRQVISECSKIVLFCRSTPHSRQYMLKTYFNFDKHQISKIEHRMKLRDRWVVFGRLTQTLMTPKSLWIA